MTNAKILIVLDDESDAAGLEEGLTELGYSVCATMDCGGEAIEKAAALGPDLALIDLDLNGEVNAIEVAARIDDRIPVVFLTDGDDEDLLARAEETQPFGYVVKPVDHRQLRLNIRTALSRRDGSNGGGQASRELEALKDRCELLESMFDSVSEGVVAIDETGDYLVYNSRAREIFGPSMQELGLDHRSRGYGFYLPDRETLFPAEDLPLRRALEGESSEDVELFVRNPRVSGGRIVSVNAMPISPDGNGARRGLIVFRDVTEEKERKAELSQAVKELKHQNRILESVLEHVDEGIILCDAMNHVLYMNPGAKRITASDTLDATPSERSRAYGIFHADGKTPVEADLLPLVRAVHGEATEIELLFRNENSPEGRHVIVSGRPLPSTIGIGVGAGMATLRDVTERKRMEARFGAVPRDGKGQPEAAAAVKAVPTVEADAVQQHRFTELRNLVQLIESACNSISDGIIVADPKGVIIFANSTSERIFGRWIIDPDVSEWSETFGVFHAEVKTPVAIDQLPLTRALQGEDTPEMELFIRNQKNRDGTYIDARAYPVFSNDGSEIIAAVGVFRDVTTEREMELRMGRISGELRDQTQLMQTIFESMREGVVVLDKEGEIVLINKSAERVFRMKAQDAPPEEWSSAYGIYETDQETLVPLDRNPLRRALDGETTDDEEFFIRNEQRPDGVYVSANARPLRNEQGEVVAGVVVLRDVSGRKMAELGLQDSNSQLRRQTRLLETIIESMDEGLAVSNQEGDLVLTNPRFEEIIGMGEVDSGPEGWSEIYGAFDPVGETLVPVEDLPLVRALGGESVREMEVLVRNPNRPDGVYVSASAQPLRESGEDEIRAAVVIFRDITSYKNTEAALERTVDELKNQLALTEAVFSSMGEGVVVADENGRLAIFNQAAERIIGMGALDIPFDEWNVRFGLYQSDEKTHVATEQIPLVRAMRGESVNDEEIFVRNEARPDGVYINVNGRPLAGSSGGAVAVFRDVTGEKEAEARVQETIRQLRDQTQLMETVFDSISDGVVVADGEGNFIIFNPAAERMVGMGMMEAPPDQWTDTYGLFYLDNKTHVPTEEVPLVRAIGGQAVDEMELIVRNDKRPEGVYLSVSGRPLVGAEGVGGGVVVFQDITNRKTAEARLENTMQELRNQNELMDTVFNNISDGIVVADEKGKFLYVNEAAEQISGMKAHDSPPENWAEEYGAFYPDRETPMDPHELPLVRAIFQGESTDDVDLYLRNPSRRDGVFIRVSGRPLLNEVGSIRGGVIAFHDVTEQMQADEALARAFAQGRLEIVDTILHNIGNAINSVTTGIETVRQGVVNDRLLDRLCALADAVEAHRDDWVGYIGRDPQGRKAMPFLIALARDFVQRKEGLEQTVDRVRDRANHIADIVRTQRALGSPHVDRKDVDLRQSLASSVRVLQDSLAKRNIEIDVDCAAAPAEIRIQESQFHQMMVNLIKNGLEAIDELQSSGVLEKPPRIGIRAYVEGEFLHVDVTDNGIGIDVDKVSPKMIFSAGYTTKESGSGLGLHSAANFVIGSGGRIHPLSEGPGKGATMRVMLRLNSVVPPPTVGEADPSAREET